MKIFCLFFFSLAITSGVQAQTAGKNKLTFNPDKKVYDVEAACGTCRFGMKGKGCILAVRYNGAAYFVEGTSIDDHGDAHAKDGFCNAIRNAKVQGEVINDKFVATYFELAKANQH